MTLLRYGAFPSTQGGGNPAGVMLDAASRTPAQMLAIAAAVGYSETAFLESRGERSFRIRYFSPLVEVDFCGHATVAAAVALAESGLGAGNITLHTNVGVVTVGVKGATGGFTDTLTTVLPQTRPLLVLDELLACLNWSAADLSPVLPVGIAFAGLWHPIIWAGTRERLSQLDYDFDALKRLMNREGWGTVSLLYRESAELIHARNPFPIGGVIEDPATGSAAGALGGFLRWHGLLPASGKFTVLQGFDMDRPSLLEVDAGSEGGVQVSGTAVLLDD